jgi:hypothetical protein
MSELDDLIEQRASAIVESQSPSESVVVKASEESVPTFDSIQNEYLKKQVEQGKGISAIATDFVKAKTTTEIMENRDGKYDGLHEELANEQKETLKQSFKQDRAKQEAETLNAKQQKAEAFYTSFRPILEFDFSALIHKEPKEGKVEKTYKDRSYGIPLMVLMLCLFTVPYCLFSILLAVFNGVNAICEAVATFSKVARVIAISIFIIAIAVLVIYFAILGIDYLFGTDILATIGLK